MKIVHLSTEVSKTSANTRIHLALKTQGINSKIVVLENREPIEDVYKVDRALWYMVKHKILRNFEMLFLKAAYQKANNIIFSYGMYGNNILANKYILDADIIHLHWINGGYISIQMIKKLIRMGKPIIWTFHDSWPFTGGCHVRNGCNRFKQHCGKCPMLKSKKKNDLSTWIMKYKTKALKGNDIICVAPSKWMYRNIVNSSLFKENSSFLIPNAIDSSIFTLHEKENLEKILQYKKNHEKYHILFGAVASIETPYKGFAYLAAMLELIHNQNRELQNKIVLHIFGSDKCNIPILEHYECEFWGHICQEEKLACLYDMANVYVFPSLDDNLPNTVMESLSCQTPVLAFDTGGVPDMVTHLTNGYIARYKDIQDLYKGLLWIVNNNQGNKLGINGRMKVERDYNYETVALAYTKVYEKAMLNERQV